MNLKNKIATIAAAAVITLSMGTSALASTSGQVVQEITTNTDPGALTASLDKASSMNAIRFSLDDGTTTGKLVLKVTDGRGTNNGWNVTLSSTDFRPATGLNAQPIKNTGFRVKDGGDLTASKGSTNGIQPGQAGATLESAKRVLWANNGNGTGIYQKDINVELAIPGGQAVGLYQADVTVNIAAAPGQ